MLTRPLLFVCLVTPAIFADEKAKPLTPIEARKQVGK